MAAETASCLGYSVFAPDGRRVGEVVASDESGMVVESRGWLRRRLYVLPKGFALVRDEERAVLSTVSRRGLTVLAEPLALASSMADEMAMTASPGDENWVV